MPKGFELPPESREKFLAALQGQGGGPGEELSPEQQQAAFQQGAQQAQAEMQGGTPDGAPAGAPAQEPAPMQPGAPAAPAAPAPDPNAEMLQSLGFGSVQELADAFVSRSQAFDQAKGELTQLLGFQQALNNSEELDPKDPNYNTRKIVREMLGPHAEEFTKNARLKVLAEAWDMDARGLADAESLLPEVNAYIQQNPALGNELTGFKQAYNAVKAGKYRGEDQLFKDSKFIEKAAKNPEVMKAVTQAYLEGLRRNGEVPPAVGQGGNTPFSGAPAKPKTIAEASAALGKLLGVR